MAHEDSSYAPNSLDWVADDDFHPDDTNLDEDYLKSEFLDLRKPLLRQVWEGNFR